MFLRCRSASVSGFTLYSTFSSFSSPNFPQKILYTEMAARKPRLIALFDVDGTLTAHPKVVTSDMLKFMQELRKVVTVGVVGGSDLVKISEQLGNSENGFVAYKDGKLIGTQSRSYLGEEKLKEFINFTLHYIADLDIP